MDKAIEAEEHIAKETFYQSGSNFMCEGGSFVEYYIHPIGLVILNKYHDVEGKQAFEK